MTIDLVPVSVIKKDDQKNLIKNWSCKKFEQVKIGEVRLLEDFIKKGFVYDDYHIVEQNCPKEQNILERILKECNWVRDSFQLRDIIFKKDDCYDFIIVTKEHPMFKNNRIRGLFALFQIKCEFYNNSEVMIYGEDRLQTISEHNYSKRVKDEVGYDNDTKAENNGVFCDKLSQKEKYQKDVFKSHYTEFTTTDDLQRMNIEKTYVMRQEELIENELEERSDKLREDKKRAISEIEKLKYAWNEKNEEMKKCTAIKERINEMQKAIDEASKRKDNLRDTVDLIPEKIQNLMNDFQKRKEVKLQSLELEMANLMGSYEETSKNFHMIKENCIQQKKQVEEQKAEMERIRGEISKQMDANRRLTAEHRIIIMRKHDNGKSKEKMFYEFRFVCVKCKSNLQDTILFPCHHLGTLCYGCMCKGEKDEKNEDFRKCLTCDTEIVQYKKMNMKWTNNISLL